jgi:hypothetical protein
MPPGLGRVAIAALGATALAAGAVIVFRNVGVGLLFALGGAALLLWSSRRP